MFLQGAIDRLSLANSSKNRSQIYVIQTFHLRDVFWFILK